MSINKNVNLYLATYLDSFIALLNVYSHLQCKTVMDPLRNKHPAKALAEMAAYYVPDSNDYIIVLPNGGVDLTNIQPHEWCHTKQSWGAMGITKAALPDILDQNGDPAMMTMNGIPIDITDLKLLSHLKKLSKYSPEVTMDALEEISKAIKLFF